MTTRAYGGILQPKAGDVVLYNWPKGKGTNATIKSITDGKADIRWEDGKHFVEFRAVVFFSSIKFIERPKAAKKAVLA